jgi:hypothetical protein
MLCGHLLRHDFSVASLERGGFDFVYLLGVWQTGKYGLEKAKKLIAEVRFTLF